MPSFYDWKKRTRFWNTNISAFFKNFLNMFCRDLKHPESSGYAFLNTKLFFSSLVDFVRYYSHCSMKEHNAQLDTKLKIPAFKGTLWLEKNLQSFVKVHFVMLLGSVLLRYLILLSCGLLMLISNHWISLDGNIFVFDDHMRGRETNCYCFQTLLPLLLLTALSI